VVNLTIIGAERCGKIINLSLNNSSNEIIGEKVACFNFGYYYGHIFNLPKWDKINETKNTITHELEIEHSLKEIAELDIKKVKKIRKEIPWDWDLEKYCLKQKEYANMILNNGFYSTRIVLKNDKSLFPDGWHNHFMFEKAIYHNFSYYFCKINSYVLFVSERWLKILLDLFRIKPKDGILEYENYNVIIKYNFSNAKMFIEAVKSGEWLSVGLNGYESYKAPEYFIDYSKIGEIELNINNGFGIETHNPNNFFEIYNTSDNIAERKKNVKTDKPDR